VHNEEFCNFCPSRNIFRVIKEEDKVRQGEFIAKVSNKKPVKNL